jgi:hypothetical protein
MRIPFNKLVLFFLLRRVVIFFNGRSLLLRSWLRWPAFLLALLTFRPLLLLAAFTFYLGFLTLSWL